MNFSEETDNDERTNYDPYRNSSTANTRTNTMRRMEDDDRENLEDTITAITTFTTAAAAHSYLPGISNPLCPPVPLGSSHHHTPTDRPRRTQVTHTTTTRPIPSSYDLPIFHPALLLPGTTCPIRFRRNNIDRHWKRFFMREIKASQEDPTHVIAIGMWKRPPPPSPPDTTTRTTTSGTRTNFATGSVGTLAVVTSYNLHDPNEEDHEDDDDDWEYQQQQGAESQDDYSPSSLRLLSVTVQGIRRFRVLGPARFRQKNSATTASSSIRVLPDSSCWHVQDMPEDISTTTTSTIVGGGGGGGGDLPPKLSLSLPVSVARHQRMVVQRSSSSRNHHLLPSCFWSIQHPYYNPWILKERILEMLSSLDSSLPHHSLFDSEQQLQTTEVTPHSTTTTQFSDPSHLSFVWANSLPLTESEKYHLLELPSTVQRLQMILRVLGSMVVHPTNDDANGVVSSSSSSSTTTSSRMIRCKVCSTPISQTVHSFAMRIDDSAHTVGAYANAYGYLHHVLTVSRLEHPRVVVGSTIAPETRDSWFPGYGWTILHCRRCGNHVGWQFDRCVANNNDDSTTTTQPPVVVSQFWGLSTASIHID